MTLDKFWLSFDSEILINSSSPRLINFDDETLVNLSLGKVSKDFEDKIILEKLIEFKNKY